MGNRIPTDPDADPEQDIAEFVSAGIDHAGLLALRVPRPTLVGSATLDFFPIEGARESVAEAQRLYQVAGAEDRFAHAIAEEKHGLTLPLRNAIYRFFERWLAGKNAGDDELKCEPRTPNELQVCNDGQVNLTFRSRPLLPMALEAFKRRRIGRRLTLQSLLRLDPDSADYRCTEYASEGKAKRTLLVCVNGNEMRGWHQDKSLLTALTKAGNAVVVVDPRGVGTLRPPWEVKGHDYADPLCGVEENIAYNAFLVGKSLLGMRTTDVLAAIRKQIATLKPSRVVVLGRNDTALVACFAAAVEPAIDAVAVDGLMLSWSSLFEPAGRAINAASVLPGILRNFGDIDQVFGKIAPRRVLVAAGIGKLTVDLPSVEQTPRSFSTDPSALLEWLNR